MPCRYVALTKGVIEVRREEGRLASAEGQDRQEYVQRSFDLTTQEGLAGYWAQLAQMSVDYRCSFSCFTAFTMTTSQKLLCVVFS